MEREYNLVYVMNFDFICNLNHKKKIAIWKDYDGNETEKDELTKVLLEPFLKNLMKFSGCNHIILSELSEHWGCFRKSLYYDFDKDKLYQSTVNTKDKERSYRSGSLVHLSNLIDKINRESRIQKFVNLEEVEPNVLKDVERFCCFLHERDFVLKIQEGINFEVSMCYLDDKIKEELISQYDRYPYLSTVALYYYLMDSPEKFINFLYKKIDSIILSQGFISKLQKSTYGSTYSSTYGLDREIASSVKSRVDKIVREKDIAISNFKKYILNEIRYDVVKKASSNVYFNLLSISNVSGVSFVDEKQDINDFVNINHPLRCKWNNYDMHCNEKDIREIEGIKFNFSEENHMIFEMNVMPKCYAPSNTYIIDVNYSFKKQGRFLYLKDNISEKTSKEELKNLPIFINQISIYTSDSVKKDWDN